MDKLKKFVKNHKQEIALVIAGMVIGTKIANRKNDAQTEELVNEINRSIRGTFEAHGGDFTSKDGSYKVPVWNTM